MRAPLMMGGELTKNDDFTLKLLTNAKVLEIEKETFCAHQLYRNESEIAWMTVRRDGRGVYVALFNIGEAQKTISFDPGQYEIENITRVTELWSGNILSTKETVSLNVNSHGSVILYFER